MMGAMEQTAVEIAAGPKADRLATIGDLAREFGLSLRALRFYEDRGLIAPLRQGVTRLYRPEDRRRLQLIVTGKKLGFTLTQIRRMLASGAALEDPRTHAPSIEQALSADEIAAQLARLERQRDSLEEAIRQLREAHGAMQAAL